MPHELEELPLFPLEAVLFPFASLRLHIFEERYRQMVRLCLEQDRPFGVVLIRSGSETGPEAPEPYLVGTAVRILQAETYEDGRMDIHVFGERRFRIRELDDAKYPYLVGRVEPITELPLDDDPANDRFFALVRERFEVLVQRLFLKQEFDVEVVFPTDPTALSFTVANMLQMENLQKQRLLETTDTLDRLNSLLPVLEQQIELTDAPDYFRVGGADLSDWINSN